MEAEKLGYRWVERKYPKVPPEQVLTLPDNICDVKWSEVEGKAVLCQESARPFKITKQEFEFYQKYHLPLPRLHPEIRLFKRFPKELMFNLHEAQCDSCQVIVQTSMTASDRVLCEECYQKKVV